MQVVWRKGPEIRKRKVLRTARASRRESNRCDADEVRQDRPNCGMANVSATMPDELTSSQLTLLVCAAAFVAATIVMCLACNWGAVALHKPSTCLWTDDASLDTGSANTVMFKNLSNCCVHLCCYGPAICGALGTSIALLIVGASASVS